MWATAMWVFSAPVGRHITEFFTFWDISYKTRWYSLATESKAKKSDFHAWTDDQSQSSKYLIEADGSHELTSASPSLNSVKWSRLVRYYGTPHTSPETTCESWRAVAWQILSLIVPGQWSVSGHFFPISWLFKTHSIFRFFNPFDIFMFLTHSIFSCF